MTRAPTTVGTYTVLASFAGSTDYTSGTASATFSIAKATPAVSVIDNSGSYNGAAFPATDTITGVNAVPGASLEGITPSVTYRFGHRASAFATSAGTYTVLASFAGSTRLHERRPASRLRSTRPRPTSP